MNKNLIINGTLFAKGNSGVQRYASNIIKNFSPDFDHNIIFPYCKNKLYLHFSEQIKFLRYNNKRNIIWTPTHIGPIFNNNQIITVHDLLPIDHEHLFSKNFVQYYKLVLPILLKKSLHLFSVSNFTKSRIIENYNINPDKISIAYNGTVFDINTAYDNTEYNRLILKHQLENKKYFIVVGNLGFHKNNLKLIQSWKKTKIDACLIFIGKLPHHFKKIFYREVYSDIRIFHFDNIKDETLALFYKNAVSLILISLYEGFGIPLIEANAMGCPVIYSQNTVLQEIAGNCNIPVNAYCEDSIIETLNATYDMRKQPIDFYKSNSNNYSWVNESLKVEHTLMNFL